jgi:hypothetical protein
MLFIKLKNNNAFYTFAFFFSFTSAFLLFPAQPARSQATQKEMIQTWTQEQKAKLPVDTQKLFSPDLKTQETPYYENWAQAPPLADLHKKGVPRAYQGKKGSVPAKLENAYRFVLEGFSLVIAEYAGNISELYFKTKSGYKQLFHFDPPNKIRPIRPGEKAPVLILIHISGNAGGWNETIYRLDKNGFLKEAGHLGGQQAVTKYVDIDNDGIMEIINSSATKHYPPELESRLKALKDYQEPVTPVLSQNTVFKWNGEKFAKIAEFYDQLP